MIGGEEEAIREGRWTSEGGNAYPKPQILTVGELLAHTEAARFPPQDKQSLLGYKAKRQAQAGGQNYSMTIDGPLMKGTMENG